MLALVIVQTVLVILLTVVVVSLLRSHADILRRLHAAGLDSESGSADGHTHGGRTQDVPLRTRSGVPEPSAAVGSGRSAVPIVGERPSGASATVEPGVGSDLTLVAFLSSGCTTCAEFWEALSDPVDLPGNARLLIVTGGIDREEPLDVDRLAPSWATTIMSTEAWDDYEVPASPYFMLVAPGGAIVGEGAALTFDQLTSLVQRAVSSDNTPPTMRRGPGRRTTAKRLEDTDEELLAAGITPEHPSLYPDKGSEALR